MNTVSKLALSIFAAGAFVLGGMGAISVARVGTVVPETQVVAAVSKQQAIRFAQDLVLNKFHDKTTVILAILKKEDNGFVHWSVDLRGSQHEYEVWVSATEHAQVPQAHCPAAVSKIVRCGPCPAESDSAG